MVTYLPSSYPRYNPILFPHPARIASIRYPRSPIPPPPPLSSHLRGQVPLIYRDEQARMAGDSKDNQYSRVIRGRTRNSRFHA